MGTAQTGTEIREETVTIADFARAITPVPLRKRGEPGPVLP